MYNYIHISGLATSLKIIRGKSMFLMIAFLMVICLSSLYTWNILSKHLEDFLLWFTWPSLCLLGWWMICCDKWTYEFLVLKDNEQIALLGIFPTFLSLEFTTHGTKVITLMAFIHWHYLHVSLIHFMCVLITLRPIPFEFSSFKISPLLRSFFVIKYFPLTAMLNYLTYEAFYIKKKTPFKI